MSSGALNVTSVDEGVGDVEIEREAEVRVREAEEKVTVMSERLAEMQKSSERMREEIETLERRREIEIALHRAGTVDMDAARLLAEQAVEDAKEPDIEASVADLVRRKPHLFRSRSTESARTAPVMAIEAERDAGESAAEDAAEEAARTGDRGALLRYLRARRSRV